MKDKPPSAEYQAFENLLAQVLSVSKTELNRRIAEEKQGKQNPKSASPGSAVPAMHS
ncbi:MAG TPA: hypothetical protein VGG56_00895 [Terracidiphilus sp.]|jgi:hypothetical protein